METERVKQARVYCEAFSTFHPVIPAVYLVFTLGMTMFCLQPALIVLSLVGGLAFAHMTRGWRFVLSNLRWQLPLVIIVALLNPLFSASGSTEVFRLGIRAVYLESLVFGACMGGLLIASVLWFQAMATLLPAERILILFGNVLPTVALMISMVMRMIPRFLRQGRTILTVQNVALAKATTRQQRLRQSLRASSVLMSWTMEDSLQTADAMRARGWGCGSRRSTYSRHRFTTADAAACAILLGTGCACSVLAYAATSQFAFYPLLSRLVVWWGYVPLAAWMLLPAVLFGVERRCLA